jgi:hypothetical protein
MLEEELKASPPTSPPLPTRASIWQMPARDVGRQSPSGSPNLASRKILVKPPGIYQSSITKLSPLTSMRRLKVNTLKIAHNSNNTLNDNNKDSNNDSNMYTDSNNVSNKNDEITSIYSDFNTEKNVTRKGDVRVFRPNKRSL